ncbi:MAG: lipoprotein [Proteobacteria bacterium]|nr:lipoprotein [Pseudomonadota bacterium]MBS0230601.1 lipoprotein [Pseudomonadota bacterium]
MIKRIALLCFLSCLLAACGNKGPLVMPDKPQTDTTTPAAEAGTPATTTDAPTSTTP